MMRCFALLGFLLFCLAGQADAYPFHARIYKATYGDSATCNLCHKSGGGSERNEYGQRWEENGQNRTAFKALEGEDPDGDGHKSIDEIRGGSNPGDKRSTPSRPGKTWARRAQQTPPHDQLKLVFGRYDKAKVLDVELKDAQRDALKRVLLRDLTQAESLPTLYVAYDQGTPTAVASYSIFEAYGKTVAILASADATGKLKKAALFTGDDIYDMALMQFKNCLMGHGKDTLPKPGEGDCPKPKSDEAGKVQGHMRTAVRDTLLSYPILFSFKKDANGPGEGSPAIAMDFGNTSEMKITAVTESEDLSDAGLVGALIMILAYLLLLFMTVRLGLFLGRHDDAPHTDHLRNLRPSLKVLCAMLFVSVLLVQALALTDVYRQTQVANSSMWSYFDHMSWEKLLGTSHAHIFGFGVMYGFIGFLFALTATKEKVKCLLIAAILWGGIFDVMSWWGVKVVGGSFEFVSITTGVITAMSTLAVFTLVARSILGRPDAGEDDPGPAEKVSST